jgi:hypothetical protein
MSEQNLEAVLLKIRKLQRKTTEAGCTPEEAGAAAAKVSELMEQYSIGHAQIELAAGVEELTGYGSTKAKAEAWRASLLHELARDTRCRAVTIVGTGAIDVVGHRDDVAMCLETWTWLCGEFEAMSQRAWKTEGKPITEEHRLYAGTKGKAAFERGWSPSEWRVSYRTGALVTILRRIREAREERNRNRPVNDSTALIVINDRVLAVFKQLHPRTRDRSHSNGSRGVGYGAGVRDGSALGLTRSARVGAGSARIA